jgi:hypothetical protein
MVRRILENSYIMHIFPDTSQDRYSRNGCTNAITYCTYTRRGSHTPTK